MSAGSIRQLNPGACRTYLIVSPSTREAALVDPVLEHVDSYLRTLAASALDLRYVVDTHSHADHVSGAALLLDRKRAEYVMHAKSPVRFVTTPVSDGSTLACGDLTLEFIETPGHTKDSVSIRCAGAILTGDWLFIGGAGRTDLPGGDPAEHWESLQKVIPTLPDETALLPAHDYRGQTTSRIDQERRTNPSLKPRAREEYVKWLRAGDRPTDAWMIRMLELNYAGVRDPGIDLSFRPEETPACMSCEPNVANLADLADTGASSMSIPSVSTEDLKQMKEGGDPPFVLDVRQPEEYVGPLGHIPGAVLVPLGELGGRLSELDAYRDKTVVAVCKSGARSMNAAALLARSGFTQVYNLAGGTQAWFEKGYPVDR